MFKDVRLFFNEDKRFYSVDAWRTLNNDEEGVVVAKVYEDKVEYRKPNYEYLNEVKEAVEVAKTFFKQIKNEGNELNVL